MQRMLTILVLVVALGACAPGDTGVAINEATGAAEGYDVLLITLDTTRADRIGCYGYDDATTPTIDRLAAEGVRVADAVTVAPVTLPAHASILTGLYPPEHSVRDNGEFSLGEDAWTLAEALQEEGYATGAFVSAFVLDRRFGLAQGFDEYDDRVAPPASAAAMTDHVNERSATATTDAALAWLDGLDPSEGFFAWVHYFDPHAPYAPPADTAASGDRYDGEIAYVDRQMARLYERLEELGRASRTLTVVVADHGEGLGEHDEETHTLLIYGSTMRVPLILHAPGALERGQTVGGVVVSVVDIYDTVLDLLGLEEQLKGAGWPLTSSLDADRLAYMESFVAWFDYGWAPQAGMRRHHDKLIIGGGTRYFDLLEDPGELTDLYEVAEGATAARRDRLVTELLERTRYWPMELDELSTGRRIAPEERARLEALGYVSAGETDSTLHDPNEMMPLVRTLDRAKALAAAGRFDEALAEIDPIVDSLGDSRTLLASLARIYVRVGEEEQAAAALERYMEIRPSSQALVLLAQIRLTQGRPAEALPLLDQAEQLEPNYGAIHIARGDMAAAAGDVAAARTLYMKAGELDPYRAGPAVRDRLARLRARSSR